ncbi:hypothetical protein ID866_3637 [Astraeus odoratus]|nr:hypothetical protein ID866_3637 [Astraeus odoratus]
MSKTSLSSVVSNLVRASMGTSVPENVPDEDLDKHVAELILKEAKQKAESYAKMGVEAYLPTGPDPNAPRPNKRFLSSIIRSTDDHNKTVLRAQALAAQEIKRAREEEERRERRARAEEAAAAERSRRRSGRRDSDVWDDRSARDRDWRRTRDWSHDWRREEDEGSEDEYERERAERRHRRRHRSRSRSDERDKDRRRKRSRRRTPSKDGDSEDEDARRSERRSRKHRRRDEREREHRHKRRRRSSYSRSRSPTRTRIPVESRRSPTITRSPPGSPTQPERIGNDKAPRKSKQRHTPSPCRSSETPPDDDPVEVHRVAKGKHTEIEPISDPTPYTSLLPAPPQPSPPRRKRGRPSSSTSVRSPSVSPPPLPPTALPSKMDKYFEDSYDPRLDVAPLAVPTVPKTGLINDAEYAAWDAMLDLLRQRREDKEEKKRLERLGFPSREIKLEQLKKRKPGESSGGDSIMDIEYQKRGSIREWDLGKEGDGGMDIEYKKRGSVREWDLGKEGVL